ncbi:MAG: hypothetical protein MUP63_02390, partial [Candidatus Nanohaloarchaeota archaeon QJJ-7]|nr:hypothetical protein [Candidatus Nanohaloarchaeota archaeon QJJ-7]
SVAYRGSIQESIDTFWDTVGAGLAFNDMIPGSPLPNTESFYQKLTEWSLKNFEDLSAQEIHENSMRLNGEDGLLAQKF